MRSALNSVQNFVKPGCLDTAMLMLTWFPINVHILYDICSVCIVIIEVNRERITRMGHTSVASARLSLADDIQLVV